MTSRRIASLVVVLAVAGCGGEQAHHQAAPNVKPAAAQQPADVSPSPRASVPPPRRSAYDGLRKFDTRARAMDAQLRAAARAINASGPPWETVTTGVSRAVTAANASVVADAIPAGLPKSLQRQTFLVYSDLVSRRDAMSDFATTGPLDLGYSDDKTNQRKALRDLGNGAGAAADFAGDLSRLETMAKALPPVTPARATSRAAAETQLLVQVVNAANGGCATHGGHRLTAVPSFAWNARGTGGQLRFADGGTAAFQATPTSGGWKVALLVC
jgi:hypothetical protein